MKLIKELQPADSPVEEFDMSAEEFDNTAECVSGTMVKCMVWDAYEC